MKKNLHICFVPVLLLVAFCTGSCIDKDYRINDIDMNVHLAQDGVTLPLARLERKTLGEFIKDGNKQVVSDDEGYYMFRYQDRSSGSMAPIEVDPVHIDFPALDPRTVTASGGDLTRAIAFNLEERVVTDIPDFDFSQDATITPSGLHRPGTFPSGMSGNYPVPAGTSASGRIQSNEGKISIDVTLPKVVRSIEEITFGDAPQGALTTMTFSLNALSPAFNQITLDDFEVVLPARYTLTAPSQGTLFSSSGGTNNAIRVQNHTITNASSFTLTFYIASATMTDNLAALREIDDPDNPGKKIKELKFEEPFQYWVDYTIRSQSGGTVNTGGTPPDVRIVTAPTLADARFTSDTFPFDLTPEDDTDNGVIRKPLEYKIEGLDSRIDKITTVAFDGTGNSLLVKMDPLGLPFKNFPTNDPVVRLTFPSMFTFVSAPELSGNTLAVRASVLEAGYTLKIDHIDFGPTEGIPDAQGCIDFAPYGHEILVSMNHTFSSEQFIWSTDIRNANPAEEVVVNIDAQPELVIDHARSVMTVSEVSERIDGEKSISQQFGLPKEVVEIERVDVTTLSGGEVTLKIMASITNPLLDRFDFDNVRIEIPDCIILAENQAGVTTDPVTGKTIYTPADRTIPLSNNVELVSLRVAGLRDIDISGSGTNKQGSIVDEIKYAITVRPPEGATGLGSGTMTVTPRIEMPDIRISKVYGKFDVPLADYLGEQATRTIKLNEAHKLIGGDSHVLDLGAPIIELTVKNPTGIEMMGNLTLTPKDANGIVMGSGAVNAPFRIAAATENSDVTKLYITEGATIAPEGYTLVDAPTSSLLNSLPHSIDVSVGGGADSEVSGSIAAGQQYDFDIDYTVKVPLEFGENLDLTVKYDADVSTVFDELAGFNIGIPDILIGIDFSFSFPMQFGKHGADNGIQFHLTGEGGRVISGINMDVIGVVAGPAEPGMDPNRSTLRVSMATPPGGGTVSSLAEIDMLHISIPVTTTGRENKLHTGDFIEGYAYIEFPNGVQFDLSSLRKKEDNGGEGEGEQQEEEQQQ